MSASQDPDRPQIRRLTPDDSELLAAFYNGLSAEDHRLFRPLGERTTVDVCLEMAQRNLPAQETRYDLVAVAGGSVVGWALVWGLDAPEPGIGLGVAGAYRGRRLGAELFDAALAWARQRGLARLFLTVVQDNALARGLYERRGFRRYGSFVSTEDGQTYDRMVLDLIGSPEEECSVPEGGEINQAVREVWERNAVWWDAYMGEGKTYQRLLIGPASERLLAVQPGEQVLDVACGNGAFSRRLAELGAQVVAIDYSERFLACARARTVAHRERIEYRRVDATDGAALLALGERRFDAAVCTMALMDMAQIEPLFAALARLLRPHGRFVFSVLHPCFGSAPGIKRIVEREECGGEMVTRHALQMAHYLQPATYQGLGVVGQPVPQLYFHRPLSLLLGSAFAAGFVVDGLEEPAFPPGTAEDDPLSSAHFEFPPVLVTRLRLDAFKAGTAGASPASTGQSTVQIEV